MILLKTLLVVIALVGLAFLGLGIRIWLRGKFADTEVETNPNMKKLGLKCAKQEEWEQHCQSKGNQGIDMSCSGGCIGCGEH